MAILTAMLVIALGTITMVAIISSQQFALQREKNEGALALARDLAVGGERFATVLLYRDRQTGDRENTDSLDDDWAQPIPPIPIDELAVIQGCVVDMQGRFNLNNLVDAEGNGSANHYAQLQRLLQALAIGPEKAEAILDWVDRDVNATVPDGAEDDYYTGLDPAYRAANAPFAAASELKLVKGFSPNIDEEREDYERLLPHVAALPKRADGGPTDVNVNTATPEVLASLGGPRCCRWPRTCRAGTRWPTRITRPARTSSTSKPKVRRRCPATSATPRPTRARCCSIRRWTRPTAATRSAMLATASPPTTFRYASTFCPRMRG